MKLVKSPLLSYLLISLIAIACLGTLSQCSSADGAKERGHDPFVLRSVLDQRARMVTLALAPDFWVAYDANHSALFKVWRDGVNFDGPVYTTKHGPQPESMGPYFMVNRFENPWLLKKGGEEMPVLARYRGHRYEKGRAILSYEIALPEGNKVKVEESPEHSLTESGSHILERVFTVEGLPKGSELLMMVSISSIPSEKSIQTDGKLAITQKELIKHPVYKAYEVQGKLRLNPEDETRLSVTFFSQPLIPNPREASQAEEEDPAMALIEASGCKTCHNSYEKAIGPAYVEVAKRYPKTEENVEMLVNKIIQGGAGAWGEVVMNAHPTLDPADARTMVEWVLELKETGEAAAAEANKPIGKDPTRSVKSYRFVDPKRLPAEGTAGLAAALYPLSGEVSRLPRQSRRMQPVYTTVIPGVHFLGAQAYAPLRENFYATARGTLRIDKDSKYDFRLVSDDGSRLTIDDKIIIDNDGLHGDIAKDGEVNLSAGEHSIFVEYFQGLGGSVWSLQWRPHDSSAFTIVPTEVLSHSKEDLLEAVPSPEFSSLGTDVPGDGSPLQGVHPSYDLSQARPDDFKPKVGGLDFLSDGRLVVSTWTPNGSIYLVEGAQSGDPAQMKAKQIASGLAEPLGLKVVDDEIYVLQKQELTHLIDHNGDDIIDEYRTLCGAWRVSANFHEFAFGLVYQDGYFYAALATAIEPGGKSSSPQIPDRGKVIKISKEDGSHEFLAHGLRTPNGIGIGVDEEIFIADNQGDWLPASKIVHVQPGAWYGSHSVDPEGVKELEETKPVVWLPQDEIGNSPSTPMLMKDGPYAGQMIHGEVTHGGVKRVFVEKVNGQYQGAVFRFTQGLEAGVNRMVWGPDGALYVGGIGSTGNWQHYGTQWYGLQRLKYNGKSTFEMLAVRAKSDGVEIEFTEPPRRRIRPAARALPGQAVVLPADRRLWRS
jgi:cytochrome c